LNWDRVRGLALVSAFRLVFLLIFLVALGIAVTFGWEGTSARNSAALPDGLQVASGCTCIRNDANQATTVRGNRRPG
jgi:hypothetical protein